MSQHAGEPIEQDPLLEFANEPEPIAEVAAGQPDATQTAANVDVAPPAPPGEAATASIAALVTRLDRLERAHQRTIGQLRSSRAEVATLVAAIDDIKKRDVRRATYAAPLPAPRTAPSRSRTIPAVMGALLGVAIGMLGWMTWQGGWIAAAGVTPVPVVAEAAAAPVEDTAPAPAPAPATPAIALASTTVVEPPTAREIPARQVVDEPRRADTNYVGTLSIDASPGGTVFIDRKPAGQTPLRVTDLKAGSHLVWIERDGYRRYTRVVQVPADRVSRLWADLEPLTP